MGEKVKYTVIIPVHTVDDDVRNMLPRAIESTKSLDCEVRIIVPTKDIAKELNDNVLEKDLQFLDILVSDTDSSFQSLVNYGVSKCDTEWFSILEFDDEYTDIFESNVQKYVNASSGIEAAMFIPFQDIYDAKEFKLVGSANEAPWASSFSEELGYLDFDALQAYYDFYLTGSILNKKVWEEIGGLKKNIKLVFWYEFMLRMTNKGYKIFVIPKVMYKHYLGRPTSLVQHYIETLSDKESKFWFDVAKKEYFYTIDRDVEYKEEEKDKK